MGLTASAPVVQVTPDGPNYSDPQGEADTAQKGWEDTFVFSFGSNQAQTASHAQERPPADITSNADQHQTGPQQSSSAGESQVSSQRRIQLDDVCSCNRCRSTRAAI